MIIDMHGHIGSWRDFFIVQPSVEWLVETNARIGIDAVGVSHLVAIGHDTVVGNEMALAAARRFPGRVGVWLVANPHRPEGAAELRPHLDSPHVWGFKLHPDVHECPITDPGYAPYLDLAQERGLPVLTHGQGGSPWSDPALVAETSARYDDLTVLMGHAGLWAHAFDRAISLANEHPGLHLEICGSRLTTRWLERMVHRAGAEKVVFGTDAVFLDPRIGLGKVMGARLTEPERTLVLGGNARRILRRDEEARG
ncbi:amidohydrolase family protein [Agromyces silvae]|uniref:amidohydrolase family protein n=1 Tax=Agromyces silvae TaxID=3388266 RepID=UPI00280B0317|nr:amidohydrolase family protein [Agromyces protaetiae]